MEKLDASHSDLGLQMLSPYLRIRQLLPLQPDKQTLLPVWPSHL